MKAVSSKQILALGYPPFEAPWQGAEPAALAAHVWKWLMKGGVVSAPLVNATLVDPASWVDLGLSPGSGLSDAS